MTSRLSVPLALLLILTAGALAFFIYEGQWFPPTLAVRFDAAGQPTAWLDRVPFIVIGTSMSFMLPAFVVTLAGILPRVLPVSILSLPNKDYWLAPERQDETLRRLLCFSLWLACLVQAFLLTIWITISRANPAGAPAYLAAGHMGLVVAFVLSLVAYVFWVGRAFSQSR